MAIHNGILDLFIDIPLPELGICEISRLWTECTARWSITIPFGPMTDQAFVVVEFLPLGVFVGSFILGWPECGYK